MVFLVLKSRIAIWYKINEEKPQNPTPKTFIVLEFPTLPESEALGPSLILLFLVSHLIVKPQEPPLLVAPTYQHHLSCGVFAT